MQSDLNGMTPAQQKLVGNQVIQALLKVAGKPPKDTNAVSSSFVGPTWGSQITEKALQALIAFFIAVVAYISIRFEPKMALAAFIAMLHDLAVTIGIYAIFGFQVTPDTVIAVLTILGYSLYDTVVVFDRIRDNTKPFAASGRMTYSAMVNLSMNQTLARSINTSMVAILPVSGGPARRCRAARRDHAAELRGRPDRRTAVGGLLVDLHRLAHSRGAEGARGQVPHGAPAPRRQGRPRHLVQRTGRCATLDRSSLGEHRQPRTHGRASGEPHVATCHTCVAGIGHAGGCTRDRDALAERAGGDVVGPAAERSGDRTEGPQAEEALNPVSRLC